MQQKAQSVYQNYVKYCFRPLDSICQLNHSNYDTILDISPSICSIDILCLPLCLYRYKYTRPDKAEPV